MQNAPPQQRSGCLLFLLITSLLFTAAVAANAVLDQQLARQNYEATDGTVTLSQVEGPERRRHAVLVVRYRAGGREHQTTPALWGVEGHEHSSPEELVRAFPVGSTARVYFDPTNPGSASLRRPQGTPLMTWIGLVLSSGVSLALLVLVVRMRRQRSAME